MLRLKLFYKILIFEWGGGYKIKPSNQSQDWLCFLNEIEDLGAALNDWLGGFDNNK